METVLEWEGVRVHFPVRGGPGRRSAVVKAVDGVSLALARGGTLGIVGESGCGKSTLARTAVGLAPLTAGTVRLGGDDLAALGRLGAARRAQMVFQDPYASLDPRMTVYDTLAEPLLVHGLASRARIPARVAALMDRVGLAARYVRKYPHEFSGGQRQRVAIARALATDPAVILADEPVSALDVSVQAQILNLLTDLCADGRLSLVLISHDLSVVRHVARRIAVMYLGRVVETGPADAVLAAPLHPYTRALMSAVPVADPVRARERMRQRVPLEGDPPSPLDPPAGCPFHPRCPLADAECAARTPLLEDRPGGRRVACWKAGPE